MLNLFERDAKYLPWIGNRNVLGKRRDMIYNFANLLKSFWASAMCAARIASKKIKYVELDAAFRFNALLVLFLFIKIFINS